MDLLGKAQLVVCPHIGGGGNRLLEGIMRVLFPGHEVTRRLWGEGRVGMEDIGNCGDYWGGGRCWECETAFAVGVVSMTVIRVEVRRVLGREEEDWVGGCVERGDGRRALRMGLGVRGGCVVM